MRACHSAKAALFCSFMSVRVLAAFSAGVSCLLLTAVSHAECSKDNDCAGEQVCESGACVAAPPAAPPSPAAPAVAAPPVTAPAPVTRSLATEPRMPVEATPRRDPRGKRHSTGMMVGGIIIAGLAVVPLYIATLSSYRCRDGNSNFTGTCDRPSYVTGGLIATGVLLAVGIP